LRLNAEKLQQNLQYMLGGRHPYLRIDDAYLQYGNVRLVDPVRYALTADFAMDSSTSIIHGDLNGYNVLVDQRNDTWLIDFANTRRGPLAHDYACFETSIRLDVAAALPLNDAWQWESALLNSGAQTSSVPPSVTVTPELERAHAAVCTVRRLALEGHMMNQRAYLCGLFFNALKLMTVMDLNVHLRDRALLSAALIAEQLQIFSP
jgi:hypothetical protein